MSAPAKIVFATRNRGKLRELVQLLPLEEVELVSLADLPEVPALEETGDSFADNAAQKARAVAARTGLPALADDSGLEVDALGGAPGVRSARYAGEEASDDQRIALLLENLRSVPAARRTARFRCAIAFVDPAAPERVELREGRCEGRILEQKRGAGGFGYDPVFLADALGQTFAEAEAGAKNQVSHRGQAMRAMARYLGEWLRRRRDPSCATGPARG